MDVDRFEVVIFERAPGVTETRSGTFARINEVYARLEKLDGAISFLRDATPMVLRQNGCRGMIGASTA
jgi:hypothetical protein